jgi:hypothetical protein
VTVPIPIVSPDVLTTGSTHRFELKATKNKAVWDLTDATVSIKLRRPDNTRVSYTATISDALNGVAYFDCETSELVPGDWQRSWRIQQAFVDITCLPIAFSVTDSPE